MKTNKPAGFWIRLFANLLDGLILFIPLGLASHLIYGQFHSPEITLLNVVEILYYILIPVIWSGYTLGKRIFGIRIARVDGKKVGLGTMIMRNIVAGIAYLFTLGIGFIVSAFMVGLREDKRTIHDFIAGTYVTYDKPNENSSTSEEKTTQETTTEESAVTDAVEESGEVVEVAETTEAPKN